MGFFKRYNPVVLFEMLMSIIVFGMIFIHPVYIASSLIAGAALYIVLNGVRAVKMILRIFPFAIMVALINPIFNTAGTRILFTYAGGRSYTLEALLYGVCIAGMLMLMICWCGCLGNIMTSERISYILNGKLLTFSMIFTMILNLIPHLKRKSDSVKGARSAIGKSGGRQEMALRLGILTGAALEESVMRADSMKCRGYGAGKRTNFHIYKFRRSDGLWLIYINAVIALIIICTVFGGAAAQFIPEINIAGASAYTGVGILAYIALLSTPFIMKIID